MSRVHLGDVAIEHKETCKEDKSMYPIVGLEHLTPEQITLQNWDLNTENTFTKVFRKGNILFGRRRAYLKKAAVAPFDGICSGDITVIEAKEDKIIPELLPFVIQNDDLFDFAVGKSAGSLSPRVKWTHLQNYEFELPTKEKQRELAKVLWAIEDTRKSYQELIKRTDELVKSQFIELFGTETNHPEDVKYVRLGELASYINGYAFKPDDWSLTGLPIVRIQNLTGTNEEFNYYDGEYPSQVEINNGDVLISWSASLGVYLWNGGKAILNQHIFKVDFNKLPVNKAYFMVAVSQKLAEMVDKTHGATMKHIVKKDFDNTLVAYPKEEDQHRFAEFVEQSDKSKFELNRALDELTATYKQIIKDNLG